MGDGSPNGRIASEGVSDDRKLIDELIFKQDLNEAHLLIGFVSGHSERSLETLSVRDPADATKVLTSGEVMTAIAEMRYPPDDKNPANSRNASILLVAKDRLSALAAPATGITIAYTEMFINAEAGGALWRKIIAAFRRGSGSTADGASAAAPDLEHDIRIDLARRTFPGLEAHARKFRVWREAFALLTLVCFFLTALAYWDTGRGRSALERLDQNWKNIVDGLKDNPALLRCRDRKPLPPVENAADAKADDAARWEYDCRKYEYLAWMENAAGLDVHDVFRCEGMRWSRLIHVWCWPWLLTGQVTAIQDGEALTGSNPPSTLARQPLGQNPNSAPGLEDYVKRNGTWQTATSILSVFSTYVLPMMFGLLGTLIGALHAILNRIGTCELAPRDLVRMQISIPAGLVAGVAVGLFLSPSSVPIQGAGGVASDLTLTASGLGFLAGYASQRFFRFLDSMLGMVFADGSPTAAAPGPGASAVPAVATRT